MAIGTKICGLKTAEAVEAAVAGGAAYVGFVFFPPSPRYLEVEQAKVLAEAIPENVKKVALLVEESPDRIAEILKIVPIDILQFHGQESPAYVAEMRERFSLPTMKAIAVSDAEDLEQAQSQYESVIDYFLFDAKPPKGATRPGGNAVTFDWSLLANFQTSVPWFLAGGLTKENVGEAVSASGARLVDLSSAVEESPGVKNPSLIRDFLFHTSKL